MIPFTRISTMKNIFNVKILNFYLLQTSYELEVGFIGSSETKNSGDEEGDRCLPRTKFNRKKDSDMYIQYYRRFESRSHFKSRFCLIVRVNVVLNRTVVVDSD